jgi:hypothetical protein
MIYKVWLHVQSFASAQTKRKKKGISPKKEKKGRGDVGDSTKKRRGGRG